MREAMDVLVTRLQELRRLKPSVEIDNLPRAVALGALDATHRFLADIGVEDNLRAPLLHLIGAMQDMEAGRNATRCLWRVPGWRRAKFFKNRTLPSLLLQPLRSPSRHSIRACPPRKQSLKWLRPLTRSQRL